MPIEDYEERLEAKRERLHERAGRKDAESRSRLAAADATAAAIPLGQPVLVGHHSEKRHRRDLDRMSSNISRGLEAGREAGTLRQRAESLGEGGISSDDPEALALLRDKLKAATATHDRMVEVNRLWRKHRRPAPQDSDGWAPIDDAVAYDVGKIRLDIARRPEYLGNVPFVKFQLSNSKGRISQVRKRIDSLERATKTAPAGGGEVDILCVTLRSGGTARAFSDHDENRTCIEFSQRVPRDDFKMVRRFGFVWSRRNERFQRMLNPSAEAAARTILCSLEIKP